MLKEQIEKYIPVNEQEKKDKEFMLKTFEDFGDVLTRENEYLHFTSSAFVVNKNRDKVLMIYHNIYNSWGWTGGHADGEEDLLSVAIREVEEETSVKNIKVLNNREIVAIDTLPVAGHVKRGKYVDAHIHLSVAYVFEADENDEIKIKEDENSNVAWQDIEKAVELSTEPHMKPVYSKIIDKVKQMK
ncbi:MAG: NUDIX hydrolase [Clostridia bacterium]|nr:NUDIX hydrolase [Clostridia bacterium]